MQEIFFRNQLRQQRNFVSRYSFIKSQKGFTCKSIHKSWRKEMKIICQLSRRKIRKMIEHLKSKYMNYLRKIKDDQQIKSKILIWSLFHEYFYCIVCFFPLHKHSIEKQIKQKSILNILIYK